MEAVELACVVGCVGDDGEPQVIADEYCSAACQLDRSGTGDRRPRSLPRLPSVLSGRRSDKA